MNIVLHSTYITCYLPSKLTFEVNFQPYFTLKLEIKEVSFSVILLLLTHQDMKCENGPHTMEAQIKSAVSEYLVGFTPEYRSLYYCPDTSSGCHKFLGCLLDSLSIEHLMSMCT